MATIPPTEPQPDTGPIDNPSPTAPPEEMPTMPDEFDDPTVREIRSNA